MVMDIVRIKGIMSWTSSGSKDMVMDLNQDQRDKVIDLIRIKGIWSWTSSGSKG